MKFVINHSYRYIKKNPRLKRLLKPIWGISPFLLSLPARILKKSFPPPQRVFDTTQSWWQDRARTDGSGARYLPVKAKEIFVRKPPFVLPEDEKMLTGIKTKINLEEEFVAIFPQGRVWGDGNIITRHNELILDLSGTFLKDPAKYLETTAGETRVSDAFPKLPPAKKLSGRTVVLAAHAGAGYYHWLIEVLPRLELLEKAGIGLETVDHFVINTSIPGFVTETLALLGIPKAKLIETHWRPHLLAEELIVPSLVGTFFEVPQWASQYFGHAFQQYRKARDPQKKIYISRRKAGHRRIENESEVAALLQKYGFETYCFENMSMIAKIELLSQASVVISPHGAGLANIVFCHPGIKVIEMTHFSLFAPACWNIASNMDMDYYVLPSRPDVSPAEQARLQSLTMQERAMYNLHIDLSKLETLLKKAGIKLLASQNR